MTLSNEQILELAKSCGFNSGNAGATYWECWERQLLEFARAIIEEHEKDREYNLGNDDYFNSWRD